MSLVTQAGSVRLERAPVVDLPLQRTVDEPAEQVAVLGLRAEEPRRERLRPLGDVEAQSAVRRDAPLELLDDPCVVPARMAARDGADPRYVWHGSVAFVTFVLNQRLRSTLSG